MDVDSLPIKLEPAPVLDTEWDEARIIKALARLQEMHIQVKQNQPYVITSG